VERPVTRATDVNRHRYRDPDGVASLIREARPDVLDIKEEPFTRTVDQCDGSS
jgi:hypothetical protein